MAKRVLLAILSATAILGCNEGETRSVTDAAPPETDPPPTYLRLRAAERDAGDGGAPAVRDAAAARANGGS